jgi:diketogulonate reductase-like aldo/keto reductase
VFLVSKVLPSNASQPGVILACERSLERLRTDRLDLYLLHWPGQHPLEETIAGFEELRAAGKIRAWGVSNFDAALLKEALALGPVACDQVEYNLRDRSLEREVAPLARDHDVALVGYTPFNGAGDHPELRRLADARGISPHQLALAFLSRHAFAIPKAVSPAHLAENAAAGELDLSDEEVRAIDALTAPH